MHSKLLENLYSHIKSYQVLKHPDKNRLKPKNTGDKKTKVIKVSVMFYRDFIQIREIHTVFYFTLVTFNNIIILWF